MSTSNDNTKSSSGSITALTAENYLTWTAQIKMKLKRKNAWNIITGEEEEPTHYYVQ